MPTFKHNYWNYATEDSIDMLQRLSTDNQSTNVWTKEFWDRLDFKPYVVFFRLFGISGLPGCIEWAEENSEERVMVMHKEHQMLQMFLFESDTDAMKFKLAWGDV
jgi:hypothetical protein